MRSFGTSEFGTSAWGAYSGELFATENAYPVNTRTVRVTFNDPPVCFVHTGVNDALNASNWAVRQVQNTAVEYKVLVVRPVSARSVDVVVDKDLGPYEARHGVTANNVKSIARLAITNGTEREFKGMTSIRERANWDLASHGLESSNGQTGTLIRTGDGDIARQYASDVTRKIVHRFITTRATGIRWYPVAGVMPGLKTLIRDTDIDRIRKDILDEYRDVSGVMVDVSFDNDTGTLLISVNGVVYTFVD